MELSPIQIATAGNAAVSAILSIALFYLWRLQPADRAPGYWAAALLFMAVRQSLILAAPGTVPPHSFAAGLSAVMTFLFFFAGAREFVSRPLSPLVFGGTAAGLTALIAIHSLQLLPRLVTLVPAVAAVGALMLATGVTFFRGNRHQPDSCFPIIGTLFCAAALLLTVFYPSYGESPAGRVAYAIPSSAVLVAIAVSLIIVTQRRQHLRTLAAQRAAEDARRRFEDIVETATAWIWEMDPQRRITYVSPQVETCLGLPPAVFIGRRFRDTPGVRVVSPTPDEADRIFQPEERLRDVRYRVTMDSGRTAHISVSGKPTFDSTGRHIGFRGISIDVTEATQSRAILGAITGAVADNVGLDYFRVLVRRLAEDLRVDHALVGRIEGGRIEAGARIRTLASFGDKAHQPEMTYELDGTPCAITVATGRNLVTHDVAQQFPADAMLRDLAMEGYAGTALRNAAGEVIGLVAVMSRLPLQEPEIVETVLAAVAPRAGAELDRQLADLALRDSEALFRTLIDNMPIGFQMMDAQGRFVLRNHTLEAWSSVDSFGVLGHTLRELRDRFPNSWSLAEAEVNEVLTTRRPVVRERAWTTMNGRDLPALIIRFPVLDGAGAVRYVGSLLTDLSSVRRLEQEVREREELFRTVLDHMPVGFQLTDADGRVVLINRMLDRWTEPHWRPLVGERLDEIAAKNPNLATVAAECREVVATGRPIIVERPHNMPNGVEQPALVCRYPIFGEAGAVRYVASLVTDLADLRRLEQDVRDREELLRTLIDHMPIGFHLTDTAGRFVMRNLLIDEWSGMDRQQALGRTHREVAADMTPGQLPFDLDRAEAELREVVATKRPVSVERVSRYPDGRERPLLVYRYPVLDPNGTVRYVASLQTDLTEVRRLEEEVRQREALLRAIIDNMPIGFLLSDPDGRVLQRNLVLQSWSGRTTQSVIGELPGDPEVVTELRSVAESGTALVRERTLVVEGNRQRPVLVHRVPIETGAGKIRLVATLVTDLTEVRRLEQEVRQREALLNTIISNMPIGFQLTDPEGRVVMLNPLIDSWTEPDMRPHLGETLRESARRNPNLTVADEECREVAATGRSMVHERILEVGKGRTLPALILRFPIFGKDGPIPGKTRVAYVASLLTDLSAIKRLETEILRNQAHLQRIVSALDGSGKGLVVEDADHRALYVNRTAEGLLGPSPSAALILEHAGVCDELQPGGAWSGEVIHETPAGRDVMLEMSTSCLDDGSVVTVLDDVTERLERERRQAELERQVQEAQRMDAVGQLAGGIAHDFNNLIGAVLGFARFITEDAEPQSRIHGYAQRIVSASQRGQELIRQILSLARREEAPRHKLALTQLVEESAQLLRATLPATHRIEIRNRAPDAWTIANPTQLTQILVNLGLNAADAMAGTSGTLHLSLEPLAPDDARLQRLIAADPGSRPVLDLARPPATVHRCHIGTLRPGRRYLTLGVRDEGSGIAPEILARIFDPFFTTKARGKGTGLGLAVVQKLVLAHEGALAVTTEAGIGTMFEIFLPQEEAGDMVAPTAPAPTKPTAANRGRVLVVDDDIDFGDMVSTAIDRAGYEVAVCASPREALAVFREAPALWDILITDQTMPEMTGLELIARLKALQPDLRCILCTGYASSGLNAAKAREAGADNFFYKPVETAELVGAVAAHLAARGKSAAAPSGQAPAPR